jgi:cytochrome b6-f complex iron-sulfur subunit
MAIIYKDGKPVVVPSQPQEDGEAPHSPQTEAEAIANAELSRRRFMRAVFLGSMGAFLTGAVGTYVLFFWPKKVGSFGSTIRVGSTADFPPGTVTAFREGRFYLVHTRPEEGGGYIALYWKCVHLGCTVPWREAEDGVYGGKTYKGIFRCPCHGSQYIITGQNFAGPAPRPLDYMEITVSGDQLSVNTGQIRQRDVALPEHLKKA